MMRDVLPFAEEVIKAVWRISVPPQAGAGLVARLADDPKAEAFLDWGGGLIWLAVPQTSSKVPTPCVGQSRRRAVMPRLSGHRMNFTLPYRCLSRNPTALQN